MKTLNYLVLAAVGFALTACTNEDLVNEVTNPSKNDAPKELSFNAHTTNQTRSNLEKYVTNFGVWAYEYSTNATATPTTDVVKPIMTNWKVEYTSTSTPVWHYNDVNSQGWKYWNFTGSTHTTFFAYAPHKTLGTEESFTESTKTLVLSYNNSLVANDSEDAGLLIADMKDVSNTTSPTQYGHNVELTFKRHTCKIQLAFISDYRVNGANKAVTIKSDITLTPVATESSTTADGHVVKSGTIGHIFDATSPTSTWSLTSDATAITFPMPVGKPDATSPTTETHIIEQAAKWENAEKEAWTWSPSSYYSVPCATDATSGAANINTILKAEFTFRIEGESSDRTATVNIPTDATNWKENYLYTYVFKICGDKNDAIVFANPTVEDYSESSSVYEYTITVD